MILMQDRYEVEIVMFGCEVWFILHDKTGCNICEEHVKNIVKDDPNAR